MEIVFYVLSIFIIFVRNRKNLFWLWVDVMKRVWISFNSIIVHVFSRLKRINISFIFLLNINNLFIISSNKLKYVVNSFKKYDIMYLHRLIRFILPLPPLIDFSSCSGKKTAITKEDWRKRETESRVGVHIFGSFHLLIWLIQLFAIWSEFFCKFFMLNTLDFVVTKYFLKRKTIKKLISIIWQSKLTLIWVIVQITISSSITYDIDFTTLCVPDLFIFKLA